MLDEQERQRLKRKGGVEDEANFNRWEENQEKRGED